MANAETRTSKLFVYRKRAIRGCVFGLGFTLIAFETFVPAIFLTVAIPFLSRMDFHPSFMDRSKFDNSRGYGSFAGFLSLLIAWNVGVASGLIATIWG